MQISNLRMYLCHSIIDSQKPKTLLQELTLCLRLAAGWMITGIAAGAYEAALKYTLNRKQFGKPLA